ncbi:uncharacterized protein [Nicotiana tomentosiformis]|uniref:uncharacterized protein n=1 Tax=Nicotiana tomentosiformis TaxID=4098 RepID=UPI00388CC850
MAKTSKSVPPKETPSASRPTVEENVLSAATKEPTPEPPPKMFIPGRFIKRCRNVSSDDDTLTESRQDKEKKRKRAPSSSSSEKRKRRKILAHKPKESTVQQKLDRIDQLRAEMDIVKAGTDEWRGRMDRLASKKEASQAQLTSAEIQLREAKERADVKTKKGEELQSRLGSAVSDRESLAKELKMAKSEVIVVKTEADEMVAQYKADAEAAEELVKNIVEHMKWQSQREALEKVHARGFDLSAKIENAKVLKAEARKLAYPEEEDSEECEDLGGSEGGENPEGDDAAPDED